ncbi:formylmethanofuran dehydrogenase subunit A [Methyloversatilis discipulorum]|uniref:formylmethanofuran dehydrogenase subunit A n=1 Tax=Methyloversatilis discipulorum TaxID=1119528 RepID=UPI001A477B5D|nr:formylmethanofuran dehydrogenase subunit A [Methyloversatilis discipulorum]MBL8466228.1 formylmethanofuran dehydrogenase subunit A [Methyloversatilis discipulorum]
MLTRLAGGQLYDPTQGMDGVESDLYIRDGRFVDAPATGVPVDQDIDVSGCIVMAGAVDIHSHIAGGNVNNARLLMPELQLASSMKASRLLRTGRHVGGWSASGTGERYARMGYTTVVEPAVLPCNAVMAHLEMADIPILDTAGLAILGNDDYLLRMLRSGASQQEVDDHVAWTLDATRCLGLKVINAGGVNAFKQNVRTFSFDDEVPSYGVSSRRIVQALQRAVVGLGVRHPLHVHCNNLGVAGQGMDTMLETMAAADGLPMHLAHVQFYAYGRDGARGFSSAASRLIDAWKRYPNITMDVGQVLFGPTVTISSDLLAQFGNRAVAKPGKTVFSEAECEGGGGVVPYVYQERNFVNTLQWAIGLEIFLLADDPARIFFTTDHPNGAPFTRYPDLFRLLMSADYRAEMMAGLNQEALALTLLPHLKREYTLYEIAVMTRSAAANLMGLNDRGSLATGAVADVAVYAPQADIAAMFARARAVFKSGRQVVRDGEVIATPRGCALHTLPAYDRKRVEHLLRDYYGRYMSVQPGNMRVDPGFAEATGGERFVEVAA